MADTGDLRQLPLRHFHEQAGARFGGFAGWSMPITYPAGVMKEHLHARNAAGLFDISHMKLFVLSGAEAGSALMRACPLDVAQIADGQAKYTFLLAGDAGIVDDLIVTRLGPTRFVIVANAGNALTDEALLRDRAAGLDCTLEPLDRVFLALQGPQAAAVADDAGLGLDDLRFMQGREPRHGWFASRTGYTGEDGFEIALPAGEAETLAATLLAEERVQWVGLAARDSLRLEAGLCLHGQDIDIDTNPVDAGLLWAIPKQLREGGSFVGAEALVQAVEAGPRRRRVGLRPDGRQPVRAGARLHDEAGTVIGEVTSGGFGPSVGHPVAMGYVAPSHAAAGTRVLADVRGSMLPVDVHSLPFTPHRYRKG
jgi:aminomethyltransferase